MSRLGLEVRARPRWWRRSSPPLPTEAVDQALRAVLGRSVDLNSPGPDEWDWYRDGLMGHVSVHHGGAGIEAVGLSVWGGNPDRQTEKTVLAALVTPLLELAEATGAVLDSNLGVIDRARLEQFLTQET